ncbi:ABC-type glycerol-3-phosphate transport system substrate-binding protein [Alteromonadaceae bacterium 2753L.S.0a.02]|nr:ABC-type glycerol-3-phosphate transport system substrate-binding protein [Alteromonadaceae bacterium 2753L.S.0a.02]
MQCFRAILLFIFIISPASWSADRTLNIGYAPLYPFIWVDAQNRVRGIYVEVLSEALDKRLGYKITYTSYPHKRLSYSLDKGSIDAYLTVGNNASEISSAANNGANNQEARMSMGEVPIAVSMMSVFTYKDHPRLKQIADIDYVSDLKNFNIVSYSGDSWAQQNLGKFNVDSSATNYSQVLRKLAKKRGDVALIYEIIGLNTIRIEDLSNDVVLASRLTTNPVLHNIILSEAIRNSKLPAQLDSTLIAMLNDGTTQRIYDRYRQTSDLKVEGQAEERKVRIGHYAGDAVGDALTNLAKDFNSHGLPDDVKMKPLFLELVPYKDTMKYALLSQTPPEIFMTWAGYRTKFLVDNNFIKPLSLSPDMLKQFDSYSISSLTYNENVYGLPWNHHIIPIIYNRKLFDQFHLKFPATLDETLKVCDMFIENNIVPFALGSKNKWPAQFWFDYLLLRTAGREFRDQLLNGEQPFTDERVKKTFVLWHNLLKRGCIDSENTDNDFRSATLKVVKGDAAMTLMGTWATGTFENQYQQTFGVDFDIAPFPVINPDIPSYLLSVLDVFVESKNSAKKQTQPVLEYLASSQAQLVYSRASGSPAPNKTIDASNYPEMQQKMLQLIRQNPHDLTAFDLSTPPLVAELAMDLFKKFLLDPDSLDILLAEADREIKKVIHNQNLDF